MWSYIDGSRVRLCGVTCCSNVHSIYTDLVSPATIQHCTEWTGIMRWIYMQIKNYYENWSSSQLELLFCKCSLSEYNQILENHTTFRLQPISRVQWHLSVVIVFVFEFHINIYYMCIWLGRNFLHLCFDNISLRSIDHFFFFQIYFSDYYNITNSMNNWIWSHIWLAPSM